MKISAPPRSDQWNAEDFIGGARTFTIAGVKPGKAEQKYDIELEDGEGRVWRPPLTVLRLLMAAWTNEAATWIGQRVTLYLDPDVKFGGSAVGGIRVSHLSGIEKPLTVILSASRGKRSPITVQPLKPEFDESTVVDALADIAGASSEPALRAAWDLAGARGVRKHPDVLAAKDKRKAELTPVEES